MSAARILLIRHGETPSNAARIVQTPDTPLSTRGERQAELLARRLAREPIGLVLSSDLRRAAMTAEAVARATGAPIEFDPLLQERNFGDVRGTAYEELGVDLFGPDYEPPGGESWAEFDERVRRAWQRVEEVAARCEGDLAVVTHGLVCRAVAADFVVAAAGDVSAADTAATFLNTSLTVLRGPAPWSLELLACSAHLDGEFPTDGAPA